MIDKLLVFGCSGLLIPILALSHHNPRAHYLVNERIVIEGVVTEFRAVNPHARIYFEVTNEEGEQEAWMAEGDSFINLRRLGGWTTDQLKPGDRIQITGRPSRDGSNMVEWTSIALSHGAELGGGNGQLEERLRFLEERLAQYRRERGGAVN